ncbi:MAG: hypothetical protein CBC35_07230 [Planctomycetes bacterium TMED75]|nr:hypothetical protein [Planctomycetaceae bacterium]OUU92497.1 MAG: hypothetical protein CBC35_07230 [Planctomycetes bacterium TMED75]
MSLFVTSVVEVNLADGVEEFHEAVPFGCRGTEPVIGKVIVVSKVPQNRAGKGQRAVKNRYDETMTIFGVQFSS